VVRRILAIPVRFPLSVMAVTLILTVLFAGRIVDFRTGEVHLQVDSSVDRLLPDGDEAREYLERMSRKFGIKDSLLVVLVMDDVFTAEGLENVARVSERLAAMEGVRRVVSLATALNIRSVEGGLEIEPFLAQIPTTREEIGRIRSDVLGNPIYAGNLVSRDSRAAGLVVYLTPMSDQAFVDGEMDLKLRTAAEEASGGEAEVLFTGPAHIKATTARLIFSGLGVILPISFALMGLIGLLAYRTWLGVLVPLATVTVAIVWTLGILAWAGVSLNLVTTIVPPLLLVLGFAYTIHVTSAYYQAHREPHEAVAAAGGPSSWALRHVSLPVVLTALTTMAGFLALTISPFGAVREFGWISLLGVALIVIVSLSFGPAIFERFGRPRREQPAFPGGDRVPGRFEGLLERLGRFDIRHRFAVIAVCAAVALVGLFGMARIEVNSDLASNFRSTNPVRLQFEAINQRLEGAIPFNVVIESDVKDAFVQPENLRVIESLQTWLEAQPEVGDTTSVVDYVKVLHRALRDGDPNALQIPERPRLTKQLLFFGAGEELASFVDSRYQAVNIHVRAKPGDTIGMARIVERLEEQLEALPRHLLPHVTGDPVLLARAMDEIAEGQIETLSLAFLFIYGILVALFTSFRVGLYALLPNALPVLVYFGVLGLTGIGLNTTTGLFACMILGIAVDDTIHFLTRFNTEARERVDEREGAVNALVSVGRPVTITTVGLCLGFLALTSSELKGQVEFGTLGAFTLAFAWLVDVTFTPALCAGMRVVTLWDVLTLDLGESPQHSIPLLSGLSKTQARIAALMTDVVRFGGGTPMCRAGDPGDELYVIIEGEVSASIATPSGRVELSRAKVGDVIGELAIYRGKRTADADAVTDVRCLRLTKGNLERLRNRYPRIGARVLWNLSEILAARLDRATQRIT